MMPMFAFGDRRGELETSTTQDELIGIQSDVEERERKKNNQLKSFLKKEMHSSRVTHNARFP